MNDESIIQYNQLTDLSQDEREFVESVSGKMIEELNIDDVNSFLNGFAIYCKEMENTWKN